MRLLSLVPGPSTQYRLTLVGHWALGSSGTGDWSDTVLECWLRVYLPFQELPEPHRISWVAPQNTTESLEPDRPVRVSCRLSLV